MLRSLKFTIRFIIMLVAILRLGFRYIDPNTGGMLFQILAIIVAFSSAIILFFSRQIRVTVARAARYVRELFPH